MRLFLKQRNSIYTLRQFILRDNSSNIKKIKDYSLFFILFPFAFSIFINLNIINFFRPFRIGSLNAKGRISIMISYIEPYVRKLRLEGLKNPLIIVINPGADPNEQLTKMYKRKIWLVDDKNPTLRYVLSITYYIAHLLNSKICANLKSSHTYKFADAWQHGKTVISFTTQEINKGKQLLKEIGIPESAEYICVGLRESAYYKQFLTPEAKLKAKNQNTEAEQDTYIRNPPLENYIPMMLHRARKGLYVVRMGQTVTEPLPEGLHPRIIDYASKYRTPFGDLYLIANCKFLVAGGAPGIWWIATTFNKPVLITDNYNFVVLCLRAGDLFIQRKLWSVKERRLLKFKESIDKLFYYSYESHCKKDGIKLIYNTPREIIDVVEEMNQRLNKTWKTHKEDEIIQKKFKKNIQPYHPCYSYPGRIGTKFIKQNLKLLID